jgi:dipeptidase D
MQRTVKSPQESPAYHYFKEICAIPHGSYKEARLADWLTDFGKSHGFETIQDASHNVIIKKPATPGYEDKPAVILQGHIDMVCVKRDGIEHNFDTDPLKLKLEGDILTAEGTTLGADDGTAACHMLALLDEDDYLHPAMECVFTTKEEVGLAGAIELDASPLKGHYMISMDSGTGRENETTVSCAGGLILQLRRAPEWEPASGTFLSLDISGLLGGHSALMIHKERGNAIKCMVRLLKAISDVTPMRIVSWEGGEKMNAIPAASHAVIAVENGSAACDAAAKTASAIQEELITSDPGFTFSCQAAETAPEMMTQASTDAFLKFFYLVPTGIRSMSIDFPGLVAASDNVGVLTMTRETIFTEICVRAAEDSLRFQLGGEIRMLADLFGFSVSVKADFSGWKFDPTSPIRKKAMALYEKKFGQPMEMSATHGGMEMGVFKSKLPDLDIVCCAPDCGNPHTPDEYLNISSLARIYEFLKDLLEELAQEG